MINNKINELFDTINNSKEYLEYQKIKDVLEKDESIISLIEEIKILQQKSVDLEYNNDLKYMEIDKEIEEKVNELNNNPIYQEYLNKINEFNDILATSSKMLEQYVNDKI